MRLYEDETNKTPEGRKFAHRESSGSSSGGGGGFKGIRASKFRHVYGTGSRRQACYEDIRISSSAHDAQFCAVNPKFVAVVLEVAGGGAFQVLPLEWKGKADYHHGRIRGHNGPVTDIKWNPFNDNVIASASDDCSIKLWYIPDGGVQTSCASEWLIELVGHQRRITYLEWHPTAENVLASCAQDHRICIWKVTTGECMLDVDCHPDTIFSMSFSYIGNLLATVCKDKMLRVLDPRSGEVVQMTYGHEGSKASKVVFANSAAAPEHDRLFTTGFSKTSSRQVALWDLADLAVPVQLIDIDFSSGVLFPFYDPDTCLVFVAGKGDGNIRYYEITNDGLHFLSEFRSSQPQRGFGVMPKRGLKANQCEIHRLYKVHTSQPLIEPISFVVPRRSEMFHSDLYPPTSGPTPALTADEWICGIDREPVKINMDGNIPVTTCKPVRVERVGAEEKRLLITSDRNNEQKFRFLAQATAPDYREVTLRDDYSDIMKEKKLRERLSIGSRIFDRNGSKSTTTSSDDDHSNHVDQVETPKSRLVRRKPPPGIPDVGALSGGEELSPRPSRPAPRAYDSSPATPGEIGGAFVTPVDGRLSSEPPIPEIEATTYFTPLRDDEDANSPLPPGSVQSEKHSLASTLSNPVVLSTCSSGHDPATSSDDSSRALHTRASSASSLIPSDQIVKRGGKPAEAAPQTKPGRIGPAPIIPSGRDATTALVKPSVRPSRNASQPALSNTATGATATVPSSQSHAPLATTDPTLSSPQNGRGPSEAANSTGQHILPPGVLESPSKREVELQKLYAAQCRQVRSLMDDKEESERRMAQMEEDLNKLTTKYQKLEQNFDRQSEEIDCLRHEISWKDARIEELQNNLYRLAAVLPEEALSALHDLS